MTERPYDRKTVLGWSLYDFANSSYTTVIVTFVYALFFKNFMMGEGGDGTTLWTRGATVTGIVVAVSSPYLGALADRGGIRRGLMMSSTVLCVVFTAFLWFPMPGQALLALVFVVISNIAFELSGVFYNSYLPDISPPERIGRISGYGWALGYVGGLGCMGIAMALFLLPDQPAFGLDPERLEQWRAVPILVAAWYAAFSVPMFLWVREARGRGRPRPRVGQVFREASRQIADTFQEIRTRHVDIFRLLAARMIYNDGLVTVFVVGPLFVSSAFGMEPLEVMTWGVGVQMASMVGAYAMGFLDDKVGGKRTILLTVVGLALGGIWAVTATSTLSIYLAGFWVGIFVGPNQAASRSLLGRFVPASKETEFYGFFALSGKAIAFLGPFLYGEISRITGSVRIGMGTVLTFFVLGGLLLLTVDEERGIEAKEATERAA
ncbi:MAG: MFS transporter [Gemmatimonadales bacterium]|nr:MAG: MFS transporter [Gemmatimonadales bacterium]